MGGCVHTFVYNLKRLLFTNVFKYIFNTDHCNSCNARECIPCYLLDCESDPSEI